jgi:hypothetical protein
MGSIGIHPIRNVRRQPALPGPNALRFFALSLRCHYGGQLKPDGEPASGLRLLVTYRYAKSLDDSTAPGSGQDSRPPTPQFIHHLRANRS